MPRVARVPAIPPLPPAIFAPPPWFSPLRPCHPPKRPIWWMNCPFVSAIHQNAPFGGRTALSSPPSTKTPHLVDGLPSQALTVRIWALFPGRSVPFQGDLPCQRPVSRKVGAFSGGPSMPEACFPEGRCLFRGTFHARGLFPGRSRHYSWGPATPGPFFR